MFGTKITKYRLTDFEIGATGPRTLQFVLREDKQTAVIQLTSDDARALIYGLTHWVSVADSIADDG